MKTPKVHCIIHDYNEDEITCEREDLTFFNDLQGTETCSLLEHWYQ